MLVSVILDMLQLMDFALLAWPIVHNVLAQRLNVLSVLQIIFWLLAPLHVWIIVHLVYTKTLNLENVLVVQAIAALVLILLLRVQPA